jgi:hypothetical protein
MAAFSKISVLVLAGLSIAAPAALPDGGAELSRRHDLSEWTRNVYVEPDGTRVTRDVEPDGTRVTRDVEPDGTRVTRDVEPDGTRVTRVRWRA